MGGGMAGGMGDIADGDAATGAGAAVTGAGDDVVTGAGVVVTGAAATGAAVTGEVTQPTTSSRRARASLNDASPEGLPPISPEATMMVSKPHRFFESVRRLRHPSGQSLYDFKEILLMLTYLAAVLGLFCLMGKISTHIPLAPK
jgi:hypothetical protein